MRRKLLLLFPCLFLFITVLTGCGEKANAVCDGCHKQKYCHFYHVYSPYGEVKDYAFCDDCYDGYEFAFTAGGGRIEEFEK